MMSDQEEEEYLLVMNDLIRLARAYNSWDSRKDELARLAVSLSPEARDWAGGKLPMLGFEAYNVLGLPPPKAGAVRRPRPPSPNELRHQLLLRIVKLRSQFPTPDGESLSPKHINALFDRAGVDRPKLEPLRHAIRKVLRGS